MEKSMHSRPPVFASAVMRDGDEVVLEAVGQQLDSNPLPVGLRELKWVS